MKNCPVCAKEVQDDVKFCPHCGAHVAATPAAATASGARSPVEPETSGMAIGSLIAGIFFLLFPAAIVAVVLGHLSRSEIRRSGGRKKGAGMALTGLILGYCGVATIPLLIIAGLVIPNLMRNQIQANEASAMNSLRTLNAALVIYNASYGSYPAALINLRAPESGSPSSAAADLIDQVLAGGAKSGYVFHYEASSSKGTAILDSYRITADPLTNQSGRRHFFTDQSGVIRYSEDGPANENSPPL